MPKRVVFRNVTMKILIIVPAYNEEESLPGVILDLQEHLPSTDIIVVDDGSTDATARTALSLGVRVISLPFNLGIGGAMQTGYQYAQQHDYDVAIQFDGDGQHLAEEIEKLLQPLQPGEADLVIGSRFLNRGEYKAPVGRKIAMRVFAALLSWILGKRLTDTTSGFRAANRRVIEFLAKIYPDDYPEVEALVLLHKAEFRIMETPVQMRKRTAGKSSITPLRSVYYMTKVLLAVFINLLKKSR
jgi:glycosyltransferase involved in cell wall biosynthesis